MWFAKKTEKSEPKRITIDDIYKHCTTKNSGTRAKKLLTQYFYGSGVETQKELIRAINAAFAAK